MAINPTLPCPADTSQLRDNAMFFKLKEAVLKTRIGAVPETKVNREFIPDWFVGQGRSEHKEAPAYREPEKYPEPRLKPDPAPLPKVMDESGSPTPKKLRLLQG